MLTLAQDAREVECFEKPLDSPRGPGDVGTVVLKHGEGVGFEVEFVTFSADTVAVVTIPAEDLRPVAADEIALARHVA